MKKNIGDKCPHFTGDDGKYDNINTDWWVSGFWPDMQWIMYNVTGEESYRDAAGKFIRAWNKDNMAGPSLIA